MTTIGEHVNIIEPIETQPQQKWFCYLLRNKNLDYRNLTYNGSTNDPKRRLRQHNGELVGGAKYTTSKKGNGEWMYYGYIENLDKSLALSLEKKIQIKSRRMKGINPLERRLAAIKEILSNVGYDGRFHLLKYVNPI